MEWFLWTVTGTQLGWRDACLCLPKKAHNSLRMKMVATQAWHNVSGHWHWAWHTGESKSQPTEAPGGPDQALSAALCISTPIFLDQSLRFQLTQAKQVPSGAQGWWIGARSPAGTCVQQAPCEGFHLQETSYDYGWCLWGNHKHPLRTDSRAALSQPTVG